MTLLVIVCHLWFHGPYYFAQTSLTLMLLDWTTVHAIAHTFTAHNIIICTQLFYCECIYIMVVGTCSCSACISAWGQSILCLVGHTGRFIKVHYDSYAMTFQPCCHFSPHRLAAPWIERLSLGARVLSAPNTNTKSLLGRTVACLASE